MTNKFKNILLDFAECICLTIDDVAGLGISLLGIISIAYFIKWWTVLLFIIIFIINAGIYDVDENDYDNEEF